MESRKELLFILGATGVGKNTIISQLQKREPRFTSITQYTTRAQRIHESGKLFIDNSEMDALSISTEYCVISTQYSNGTIRYAVSYDEMHKILEKGGVPIVDWAISRMKCISPMIRQKIYSIYLLPPSLNELERRLRSSQRNNQEERIEKARREVFRFHSGEFAHMYNASIINADIHTAVEEALLLFQSEVNF